jgi:protease-4
MSFLKVVFATIVGLILFSIISFLFLAGTIGALSSGEAPQVASNSVLYLSMQGQIDERVADDPFNDLLPQSAPTPTGLLSLLETIEKAKNDDNIRGIYMENGFVSAGYASLQEIRDALLDFKESEKFIISYGEYMSEADYYLASAADEIHMNPEGMLEFNGLNATITFFKGSLDKLGIEAQIFRVGDFKSAVEPFMLTKMSDENRAQVTSYINDLYDYYLAELSKTNGMEADKLSVISDSMLVRLPQDAVDYGLVTQLSYKDQVRSSLREKLGISETDDIDLISHKSYSKATAGDDDYSSNRIAVIVANGEIVSGSGDADNVGGEKFAKEIRKARENSRVKAIILRINSPGGSLTGSDVIWREVMLTKGVKPIIASMGDVAASGGYYIAMACDTIIAQPNTITGSIGIFGMLFNLENFLEDKLGITNDVVNTGTYSNIYNITRSLTPMERQIIQNSVNKGYETFTTKAAEGRNMEVADLKSVASGRVWTGKQAKERGLVDVLGSFDDAVSLAANAANLESDYMLVYYPAMENILDQFIKKGQESLDVYSSKNAGIMAPYIKELKSIENMRGLQARVPFQVKIN